jgi:hypothetical protein
MSRGGVIENVVFRDNVVYNSSSFILLEMDYHQQGKHLNPPKDYAATTVRNISFLRNRAMGGAVGASFGCSVNDACHDIVLINNTIANAKTSSPWSCHYIESYTVSGNAPTGLDECMAKSMNGTTISREATIS